MGVALTVTNVAYGGLIHMESFWEVLMTAGVVAGAGLAALALHQFRAHNEEPRVVPLKYALIPMVASGLMLSIPAFLTINEPRPGPQAVAVVAVPRQTTPARAPEKIDALEQRQDADLIWVTEQSIK